MKKIFLLILFLIPFYSQSQFRLRSLSLLTRINGGMVFNNTFPDKTTEDLVYWKNKGTYFSINSSIIFKNHWGHEFKYSFNLYSLDNYTNITSSINQQYGSDYYTTYAFSENENFKNVTLKNFLTGISYKLQYKKIYFVPKFLIGIASMPIRNAYVELKKKNSNEILLKKFQSNNGSYRPQIFFELNPCLDIGWLIYKNFGINLELNYYQFKVNSKQLKITVDESNELTGENSVQVLNYHKMIRSWTVGIGVCYYLRFRPRL